MNKEGDDGLPQVVDTKDIPKNQLAMASDDEDDDEEEKKEDDDVAVIQELKQQ